MKKQLLLLATFFIASFSFAQFTPSFGVRGGLSSAHMQGDAVNNLNKLIDLSNGMVSTTATKGFYAGTYANLPISEKFSIEPALYYTQKGYELKSNIALKALSFIGVNAKSQLRATYIDLPVLAKVNMGGFQVFAGPQVSYLTKAEFRTTAGLLGLNLINNKMDLTDQFNRWDAGLTGGVGYQFANGLNITAAYDHGLSRVDANQSVNSYNRSVKVGIGMSF